MIGARVLNYTIVSLLGEGGMGAVYLAQHAQMNRKVAIKMLRSQFANSEEIRLRFQNEAATMAHLQHSNIVTLHDYLEDDSGMYLIMEYVEGTPLDDYITKKMGPIPEEHAVPIMLQVLSGFAYAHSQKVVHRDIKPSNIIVCNDGTVKILDFGIAKLLGDKNQNLTKTGSQMGTVYYMSPEQVQGKKVDHRSDIYSLGITFYQMLTGINPYKGLTTDYEIFNKIVKEELPDPMTVYPGVPGYFKFILEKALKKEVEERFQSCDEFANAIREKGLQAMPSAAARSKDTKKEASTPKGSSNVTPTSKEPVEPVTSEPGLSPSGGSISPPVKRKHRGTWAWVAVVIVVLAGGIYLAVSTDDPDPGPIVDPPKPEDEKVVDIDGNEYETFNIGDTYWMSSNLKVSKFRDGTKITHITDDSEWSNTEEDAWCYYDNDKSNESDYGKLYNWYAVNDSRGLCPEGWHVPTDDEWNSLVKYLDTNADIECEDCVQSEVAGGALKSKSGWDEPNEGATNESGFTGLPGGFRHPDGGFNVVGYTGLWWSSSDAGSGYAWSRYLYYDSENVYRNYDVFQFGFSVRCARD